MYLSQQQPADALLDAEMCRSLRPDWPKGCYRLGAARMACGLYVPPPLSAPLLSFPTLFIANLFLFLPRTLTNRRSLYSRYSRYVPLCPTTNNPHRYEDAAVAAFEGIKLDNNNADLKRLTKEAVAKGKEQFQKQRQAKDLASGEAAK